MMNQYKSSLIIMGVMWSLSAFAQTSPQDPSYSTNIPHFKISSAYAKSAITANIVRYQDTKHDKIQAALDREHEGGFVAKCTEIFAAAGIPTDICWLAQLESAWQSDALSAAGAYGYWQFEEFVAIHYGLDIEDGIDERTQFEPSTRAASKLLRDNHEALGDWALAIGAYNCGLTAMNRAIDNAGSRDFWFLAKNGFLPPETANYVPAFTANIQIGHHPEEYGFSSSSTGE